MSDVVIQVENLWKQYRYGSISHATLRKDIQSWWARMRSKEDPNLPVDFNLSPLTNNVSQGEDRFWALQDVSFEVKQGEVLGIIGRNGAGKSTILKIMSKVTTPTKGEIKIKGRVASLLEVGTGFHPELTGRENIFLNGAILGMTKDEIKRKFDEIVAFAEVEKFIDTPVKRYSSGMYVRLAFAVAAHLEPEILIVDEVLAVGDSAFQKKCLGKMGDVAKEGRTVLFVSHNMAAVQKLCSRVVWLRDGFIAAAGETGTTVGSYLNSTIAGAGSRHDGPLPSGFIYYHPTVENAVQHSITAIELVDRDGSPLHEIGTWDYVRIRIHYHAKRRISRGSVVLQVFTQEGISLLLCSTSPDSTVPCSIETGNHYAECIFPKWPLAAGEYVLSAGLAIPGIEYVCRHENICTVTVSKRDVFGSGLPPSSERYLVAVDHHWEIPASQSCIR